MSLFRKGLAAVSTALLPAVALAEETAGDHGGLMTHVQGVPVIAIVAGTIGVLTIIFLVAGVVAGYLTSRDWPKQPVE